MKSQKHNEGKLKELKVEIEEEVVDCFLDMAEKTNMSLADLVVIALKRFKASHGDYQGSIPEFD